MSIWVESHTVLSRHRKVSDLADALLIKKAHAVGLLHCLWHSALEQQEDGDLSKWSDSFISEAAGWDGDPVKFVAALTASGFMDDKLIHDWPDYAGRYLIGKYHTSGRSTLVAIWRKHGRIYGSQNRKRSGSKQEAKSHSTLPNHTLPNQTLPTSTDTAPRKFVKPTAQEVTDYAQTLSFALDGQKFVDHYEARGWQFKNGQPVKDWKACVRTWKSNVYGGANGSNGRFKNQSLNTEAGKYAGIAE
jgi:hypothetical protein